VNEVAHVPVLLEEAVTVLRIREDGTYVDGTFGRGGHSAAILARLGVRGRLLAFDQDPAAHSSRAGKDHRLELIHDRFSNMTRQLAARGIDRVAGVLLDLGISSPQVDEPSRGFSFAHDGPLDMRMDTTRGETAAAWLNHAPQEEITEVIQSYGEERFAKQVARAIVEARGSDPIRTTRQLAEVVGRAVRTREPGKHPATRTFQALRIFINQELEELAMTLPQTVDLLEPGGRLAVISFHSLEDRIVKRFMRNASRGDTLPKGVPVRAKDIPAAPMTEIGRAVKPTSTEIAANPRSRSAVMRVAEKN
jgi:16S rRNA (cytosine1402-N4)-methyltransferase